MKDLIPVTKNEKGQQIVSARELYEGLGLDKSNWKRWYKKNILENEYFKENDDWAGFVIMTNGNETQDFAITLDFAKHIAMMARTEKSHQYRNYFIECEKQLKDVSTKDKYISEIDMAKAEISLTEVTARVLKLNEISTLAIVTNIYENHGIPTDILPVYTTVKDAPKSATDLLRENNVNMSTRTFNKLLVERGILKVCTRTSSKGKEKRFKKLVDTQWGENRAHPKCPNQTQPAFYEDKFPELLNLLEIHRG